MWHVPKLRPILRPDQRVLWCVTDESIEMVQYSTILFYFNSVRHPMWCVTRLTNFWFGQSAGPAVTWPKIQKFFGSLAALAPQAMNFLYTSVFPRFARVKANMTQTLNPFLINNVQEKYKITIFCCQCAHSEWSESCYFKYCCDSDLRTRGCWD
jgi:hypothetical protein